MMPPNSPGGEDCATSPTSDSLYRNFFNLPLVGTAITSRTKGWVEVNDATCEILGYPREELFQKTWADITHPDDLAADEAQFARMLRREIDGYQLEKRFIRKDGTVVHTLLAGGCGSVGDKIPELFYVNILDISERKKVEAELAAAYEREKTTEQKQRELIEDKLKTSLNAAAVAHEINQPLSRILLRARLDLEKDSAAGKETLLALIDDAERVVTTIEKMKVLLRNVETVQKPVDLAQIVRSSLHQLKQPLRSARVKVTHTGPEQDCVVLGDDVQLQMILTNLVRNAIEAISDSNSPQREISITRILHEETIELVIGDSGPGWPGGTIEEMLLQTSKPGGSGIGLYVVKTAMENHRSRIEIGRSPLGGAEFRLAFRREK